jgi:hypothetical protein
MNDGEARMVTVEKIGQRVQQLPEQMQAEVLDFVEFLLTKAEREGAAQEEREWSQLSISLAMRDLEEEEGPTYAESDLKETFS